MTFDSSYITCQVPRRDGSQCFNEPDLRNPWGVCRTHWQALAQSWTPPAEQPRRIRCIQCGRLTATTSDGSTAFCADAECGASFSVRRATRSVRVDIVYYMRFASRIKIGTTTNLLMRCKSIYHDELLAIELGGLDLERSRHEQFSKFRVEGQREWFHADQTLTSHARELRRQNGEPMAAFAAWHAEAGQHA